MYVVTYHLDIRVRLELYHPPSPVSPNGKTKTKQQKKKKKKQAKTTKSKKKKKEKEKANKNVLGKIKKTIFKNWNKTERKSNKEGKCWYWYHRYKNYATYVKFHTGSEI